MKTRVIDSPFAPLIFLENPPMHSIVLAWGDFSLRNMGASNRQSLRLHVDKTRPIKVKGGQIIGLEKHMRVMISFVALSTSCSEFPKKFLLFKKCSDLEFLLVTSVSAMTLSLKPRP